MEEQMKVLVHQRGAVKGKLTRVKSALRHSFEEPNPNIMNIHFLQLHQKTVEHCYREYNDFQNKIYELPLSDERRAEQIEKYVEFESLYNDMVIQLSMLMGQATKTAVTTEAPLLASTSADVYQKPIQQFVVPAQPYLPPLQVPLPTFDGSYEKWYSFKSMFTTVMDRYQQEDPALKLYHLRNCLVGQAAGIIDQDLVNNNDYEAAWMVLKQRFEDKRIIIDKHVEKLFNLPRVGQENATNMRKMIDTCTKNVEALRNLDLPIAGLGEQMLVNLITEKMDKKLRVAWEARQKKDVLPTYVATLEFLQEQCRIYEKIDTKPMTESVKPKAVAKSHTLVSTSELKNEHKCQVCKAHHELWKCETFRNKSVSEKYDSNEVSDSVYYLPHHCVLRPTSTTTKLRVVYDGSARTSTGVSINDVLMTGPTIQKDLVSILLRFRGFQYVFTLDIPKMFRQVSLQPYLRIFWRDNRNDSLAVYELLTITYGLASSPFQATMALKQTAIDHGNEFPEAAKVIERGTYMDDILTGADSLAETCQLQRDVTSLLAKGCFGAHKWCANHSEILQDVPESLRGNSFEVTDDNTKNTVKTLGVMWNPIEDWFSVSVLDNDDVSDDMTRRRLLSQLARIFDPLGLFGPVITIAKLILREVSMLQIEWDDPVPYDICSKWRSFRNEMTMLNAVHLPRWISSNGFSTLELHGFSDASDLAYGACLYSRSVSSDGTVRMTLICSKSRILPKKKAKDKAITTPRAELLAAALLSRLVEKFLDATELEFVTINLWSDSKIVLAWIKKGPQELHTYVSNRVSEIQKLTSNCSWRYIPSHENPADLISRGEQPKKLINANIWWNGPPTFNHAVVETIEEDEFPNEELPEMRTGVVLALCTPIERMPIFDKVSSFTKVVRYMIYLMRFVMYIKSRKKEVVKGPLTSEEKTKSILLVVRLVQRESFRPEIEALMSGAETKHRLNGLKAFFDPEDGILRVGGRIKRAFIPYDSRHQMLLPAKHPITEALVRHLHLDNLHIGQKGLLAIVRQRYWPLNVKTTIRNCITCFKANPFKTTQMMGDLPAYRIRPAPAFSNTGVDYAGPFWVKSSSTARKPIITKAYVSLFVCMQTRAIHLELVSDLTTDAFLAALRRFTSRRFVGAKTELHELWLMFRNQYATGKIINYCTDKGINWSFIPPRSPHFGGIWEAGVKQVKYHLTRIVGNRKLTYEELYTTLTQIEAVLNSRPLASCSDDPNDYTAITPAHFLIGHELQAVAEPSYLNLKQNMLSRWQLVQTMVQHFWRRWTAEYLPELQSRVKWLKKKKISEGGLVLLVDENTPPLQWVLGRIITTHSGDDDVTRVVTVRSANGAEFKRAVTEVCLLPLDQEN
ncbi:uncharacterized protein LOC129763518 [Toxorhynchites rutilus septentrionalis]|uniref:uncharacterized protein LOC129763518 n=1 Tax=Toxorhynchites rutilus septentrionalis TaxID=329112 RepID=UPI00247A61AD|nr:uncharacterized protein LOC129763518 [Toxorhynchites rutilus septentrionalis]